MNDANKTELSCDVTSAASLWLDGKGFKPVETEVSVEFGWVADVAGVIVPTQTELIDLKLITRRPSWKSGKIEVWTADLERIQKSMTCLIEVKTTRGDFRGDRKWKKAIPTNLAYLAVPVGLIRPDEWPDGWGILDYCADGQIRQKRAPVIHQIELQQKFNVVLQIAVRRDHHTRYARNREYAKEARIREGEERQLFRIQDAIRALVTISRGERGSVEGALAHHGVKAKLPRWTLEEIQKLWGIAIKAT